MEHRGPPIRGGDERQLEPDIPDIPADIRRQGLEPVQPRLPIPYRRLVVAVSSGVLLLFLSVYLGSRGIRAAVDWLSDQAPYQIPFESIRLATVPPQWYRGGGSAFLKSVRTRADEQESLPVLKLERDRVKMAFLRSPWVHEVVRVSYLPGGVAVELAFREPAALVLVAGGESYLLDETAIILPLADVDLERLKQVRPLVTITGVGLSAPADPRPGAVWTPKPGVIDLNPGNGRIPACVRLADFFARQMKSLGPACSRALEITQIIPTDRKNRGLFMLNAEQTTFLWGDSPGEESPDSPSADEKWAAISEWALRNDQRVEPSAGFWRFVKVKHEHGSKIELQFVATVGSSHSTRQDSPKRDDTSEQAKPSG
jgi:hypothetical protein